jgi:hypothetical protein
MGGNSIPAELAGFKWILDAKNKELTKAERIWKTLVAKYLEFRSAKDPLICLIGADYSHMEDYLVSIPEHLESHVENRDRQHDGYDIGRLILDYI